MNRKQELNEDIKLALKSGQSERRMVLSLLKAAVLNEEIARGKKTTGLTPEEFFAVTAREVKKRHEAIEQMKNVPGVVAKETREIKILEKYLPEPLPEAAIRETIKRIIGAGTQDMGGIMKKAMASFKGRADASKVRKIVEEEL